MDAVDRLIALSATREVTLEDLHVALASVQHVGSYERKGHQVSAYTRATNMSPDDLATQIVWELGQKRDHIEETKDLIKALLLHYRRALLGAQSGMPPSAASLKAKQDADQKKRLAAALDAAQARTRRVYA